MSWPTSLLRTYLPTYLRVLNDSIFYDDNDNYNSLSRHPTLEVRCAPEC